MWRIGLVVALGLLVPEGPAIAFSQGSPICEVNQLPLVEMSPALAQPPPSGWRLEAHPSAYSSQGIVQLRITHPQPKSVRGVLIWAKQGPQSGSGTFLWSEGGPWQPVPPPAACTRWALTHRDAQPKPQSALQFRWQADSAEQTIVRAFVIEDCGASDCRAFQALTNLLVLERALHQDSFEATAAPTGAVANKKGGLRRP